MFLLVNINSRYKICVSSNIALVVLAIVVFAFTVMKLIVCLFCRLSASLWGLNLLVPEGKCGWSSFVTCSSKEISFFSSCFSLFYFRFFADYLFGYLFSSIVFSTSSASAIIEMGFSTGAEVLISICHLQVSQSVATKSTPNDSICLKRPSPMRCE